MPAVLGVVLEVEADRDGAVLERGKALLAGDRADVDSLGLGDAGGDRVHGVVRGGRAD